MSDSIPLVDISEISMDRNDEVIDDTVLRKVGTDIVAAFSTYGFCYFVNHGISQDLVDKNMAESRKYFTMPLNEKKKAKCGTVHRFLGYVSLEGETVNPDRPSDYREGFIYHPIFDDLDLLPSTFLDINQKLFDQCLILAIRVSDALSLALNIDVSIFRNALKTVRTTNNYTSLRPSYYPPIQSNTTLKTKQIRCGEHSDYGNMTFLFQDDCGGLEVKSPKDEYIPVLPIPGTIVANIGDLMQRWTADTLVATKHRVVIPQDNEQRNKARQSIAFFVQPDNDCLITCLDGSNKYEPITSGQHVEDKMYVS